MRIKQQSGFTLIELLVAVAIVGILAAVAIPSYDNAMMKNRRASAESHLMDIAQRQHQYLLDNRSYASDLSALGVATPTDVSTYYDITCCNKFDAPPRFSATTAPKGSQVHDACGTLSIDQSGQKQAIKNGASVSNCW